MGGNGRLSAHHGAVAGCGVAGGKGSGAADLATRRAEGAAEAAATRAVVAGGWFVCAAAAGACESCVELRFCEGDDERWTRAARAGGDRRVHAGMFGAAGSAAFGEFAGDRNVGGCDAGARDPGAHSFGQWAGVHCQGIAEVAGESGHEDVVHRAGKSVGERICESFNGKLRDEFLNGEIFYSLKEAQILTGEVAGGIQHGAAALGTGLQAARTCRLSCRSNRAMEIWKTLLRFPHPHTPGDYDGQMSNKALRLTIRLVQKTGLGHREGLAEG